MNLIKYFCIQLIQFFGLILIGFYGFYFDSFIDLMAIIIVLALIIIAYFSDKEKKGLKRIRLSNKILISVLAIFIDIIVLKFLTGEMRF